MSATIIGIDCAVQPERVGLARARFCDDRVVVTDVRAGERRRPLAELVASWVEGPTLLALDAPLGWPTALAAQLGQHRGGQPLLVDADLMFRRHTDRVVYEVLRKQSLDVGADRIARTAHAALRLLARIGERLGRPIPLAWSPPADLAAIEVYPAATSASRRWPVKGYKSRSDRRNTRAVATTRATCANLVDAIVSEVELDVDREILLASDDALDAVLCVVAAADFLRGRARPPTDEERQTAQREGWIWFAPTGR